MSIFDFYNIYKNGKRYKKPFLTVEIKNNQDIKDHPSYKAFSKLERTIVLERSNSFKLLV